MALETDCSVVATVCGKLTIESRGGPRKSFVAAAFGPRRLCAGRRRTCDSFRKDVAGVEIVMTRDGDVGAAGRAAGGVRVLGRLHWHWASGGATVETAVSTAAYRAIRCLIARGPRVINAVRGRKGTCTRELCA